MKIEDVVKVIEDYLKKAELSVKNQELSNIERIEARGARDAYAHTIGLLKAVLSKKGWT
jgi:hypothetical protein